MTITLEYPSNEATDVDLNPQLGWSFDESPSNVSVRVATDPDMLNVIIEAYSGEEAGSIALVSELPAPWEYINYTPLLDNTLYYWRVTTNDDADISPIFSFTTLVLPIVADPSFSPSGGTFNNDQNVSLSCLTEGSTIRFTTNGDDPTEESTPYFDPIPIIENRILKAKAFQEGYTPSGIVTQNYYLVVSNPTIAPSEDTYYTPVNVSISSDTIDALIYYTTNGDDPTEESTLYTGEFSISESMTIKAKAFKTGYTPSEVISVIYTLSLPVATPVISPSGGNFEDVTDPITLSCETSDSTIYYTENGDDPTEESTLYSTPFTLSATTTLKVKAFKAEYIDSGIAEAIFTISSAPAPSSDVITATYHGQNVSVIKMDGRGQSRYTAFIDASGNLKIDLDWLRPNSFPIILATSATP